jgi:hypothetical protein
VASEGLTAPCDGTPVYSEHKTKFGARYIKDTCTCGKVVGTHLLFSESEIRFWCDRVITEEMAIESMSELRLCHLKGVTYDAYMGFHLDGEEMTDEEYEIIRERLEA